MNKEIKDIFNNYCKKCTEEFEIWFNENTKESEKSNEIENFYFQKYLNNFWKLFYSKSNNFVINNYFINYLLYINNRIVNSINFFSNFDFLDNQNKRKSNQINTKSQNVNKLKDKINFFLEFENAGNLKKLYEVDYLSQGDKIYNFSKLLNELDDEKNKDLKEELMKFLSKSLFISKNYLEKNFKNDFEIFQKIRNEIKIERQAFEANDKKQIFNLTKEKIISLREIMDKKNVNFFEIIQKMLIYLNESSKNQFLDYIYSSLYEMQTQKMSTLVFEKWNQIFKMHNKYPEMFISKKSEEYKNFSINKKNFILSANKQMYKEKKQLLSKLVNQEVEKFRKKLNEEIFSFLKENLYKEYVSNAEFYESFKKYLKSKFNRNVISETKEDEFSKKQKKYIINVTQYLNVKNLENESLIEYKNINQFIEIHNMNLNINILFLKYIVFLELYKKEYRLITLLTSMRHGTNLFQMEYFDINDDKIFVPQFNKFVNDEFYSKIKEFEILNSLKFKNSNEENIKQKNNFKNLKGKVDIKNNKESFRNFLKIFFVVNVTKKDKIEIKNKKQEYDKIFSYFASIFFWNLNKSFLETKSLKIGKLNNNNYLQEFRSLHKKYNKEKVQITNSISEQKVELKSDSLQNFIKLILRQTKNFNYDDLRTLKVKIESNILKLKNAFEIKDQRLKSKYLDFYDKFSSMYKKELFFTSENLKEITKIVDDFRQTWGKFINDQKVQSHKDKNILNKDYVFKIASEIIDDSNSLKNLYVKSIYKNIQDKFKIEKRETNNVNSFEYFFEEINTDSLYSEVADKNESVYKINEIRNKIKKEFEDRDFNILYTKKEDDEFLKFLEKLNNYSKQLNYLSDWWFDMKSKENKENILISKELKYSSDINYDSPFSNSDD